MSFADLPPQSSWRHTGARDGHEVLFHKGTPGGHLLRGHTTAIEDGAAWSVGYDVETDGSWTTRRVRAVARTAGGDLAADLERRDGAWFVDGAPRPDLDGCVDVDFESSSVTNLLPVRRLTLAIDETVSVPAAFVRADDLRVERLEQTYTRLRAEGRFAYTSTTFDFACELEYDGSGLIVNYPGIAVRLS
ncbi:putative glycolipid-binding domain-containing protein [Aeromicrobium sp. Sec7.5]|uniref:putative glycolipid-binding domain-containing protein n=1 Tax=Aeromicrobium sp. Sec7.5 TaxID=3121276 RepID=UPI002FE430CC